MTLTTEEGQPDEDEEEDENENEESQQSPEVVQALRKYQKDRSRWVILILGLKTKLPKIFKSGIHI